MSSLLWKIKEKKLNKTNLFLYSNFIKKSFDINIDNDFNKLWKWSIENTTDFWNSVWDFTEVKGKKGKIFLKKSEIFYKNKFFPHAELNYAENLLKKNDKSPAIIFKSENGYKRILSWEKLHEDVGKVSNWMNDCGIKKGDRIAAYMPNIPETVVAYLSSSTIGAIWSSCSPDFGTAGVIDRFSQINPKVLFICEKYFYNGKEINTINRLKEIIDNIPSILKVVIIPYPGTETEYKNNLKIETNNWNDLINSNQKKKISFKKLNFNDPLAILYSSGTTGKPKCICHGTGGVLLQHNKELQLHSDVKENDH